MLAIEEFAKRSGYLKNRAERLLLEAGCDCTFEKPDDADTITIVFAGQYSAGKSSILKMLTGDESIEIGAGITTETTNVYNWNGMEIIDTPGIRTELRPDHDEISYSAIAKADILVFVVTNELFDDHMGKHFRKLAIDKDKAGEMVLVVNKMERETDGNTLTSQKIKRDDLAKVLVPYTPEQLNICFLDAESYLEGVKEAKNDPAYSEELIELSGYAQFISILNSFVEKHGIAGKLTTLLYQIDEKIQEALKVLEPNSDDDIRALEEQLLQQRQVYTEARYQIKNELTDLFVAAAAEIRDVGLEIANQITEDTKKEDAEQALEDAQRRVENIAETCQRKAHDIVVKKLSEVEKAIDDLENSEFSCNLKARLSDRFGKLPEKIQNVLNQVGGKAEAAGKAVVGGAYKAGVNGGLKLSNFSGSAVHEMVLKVGHFFGHKFKPWEAVKWTKGVAIAGHALAAFGVVFSIGMQAKADYDEAKMREQMKENRQNVRSAFNSVAKELEAFGNRYIQTAVSSSLDLSVSELDENIKEIRSTRQDRSQSYRQLEMLQGDCVSLIQEIHSVSNWQVS